MSNIEHTPLLHHGGRLRAAAARYRIPLTDWLDLSTGINPRGWPVPTIPAELWQRLPEDDDALEESARAYYDCSDVLPTAGSQAALQLLPRLRAASRVGVLHPSYQEHAYAWRMAGHTVHEFTPDRLELAIPRLDVVILVNPNNPSGECFDRETLLAWHHALALRGGWLIIDEAFMDATPHLSMAPYCHAPGLIVLRSLGKFFGLAGARVGFVCAENNILDPLRVRLGPWPIASPARWIAIKALSDSPWQRAARDYLHTSTWHLAQLLSDHAHAPHGGSAFFQWHCSDDAQVLHERLAQQGILTRFFDHPKSIRCGLPQDVSAWRRLTSALKNAVQ
ncbi:MAG: threonine-phosphate decarboxylase CobD [Pseudomonadota bacterium]